MTPSRWLMQAITLDNDGDTDSEIVGEGVAVDDTVDEVDGVSLVVGVRDGEFERGGQRQLHSVVGQGSTFPTSSL